MSMIPHFVFYEPRYRRACLALFDANCPEFFAPNERADYECFLNEADGAYRVCLAESEVVGAFGVIARGQPDRVRLNWIMIDSRHQGAGLGRAIMIETTVVAHAAKARVVDIAASHRSAPFFARFGASEVTRTEHGWGPGMHRIDMGMLI